MVELSEFEPLTSCLKNSRALGRSRSLTTACIWPAVGTQHLDP
jgi:hypothetical protein